MREYSIAAISADGIGPEVIDASLSVLEVPERRVEDVRFNVSKFDWGTGYHRKHGVMMPADGLKQLKPFDAILFGAVGAPIAGTRRKSARRSPSSPRSASPGSCVMPSHLPYRVRAGC
jgi:isocitrate/isopropylmalate dehydrogenase